MFKIKTIIILAALLFAGVYFFLLNPAEQSDARKQARAALYGARYKALSAVKTPGAANGIESARICVENLRSIETAKRIVAEKKGISTGDISDADVVAELPTKTMPVCPSGGTYTIQRVGTFPTCTIGGGTSTSADDDHVLRSY